MKTALITLGVVFGTILLIACIIGGSVVSVSNREVILRVTIYQKQEANKTEFDNMFKKIAQSAQVTEGQKNALAEIFNGYAQARSGSGKENDNLIFKWVQESVPNVDVSIYRNLQNIITSSRDSWTMRQTELLDLKREHDKILGVFPSGWILGMMGRKPIDVIIITSSKTQQTFATGKDDDIGVFQSSSEKSKIEKDK